LRVFERAKSSIGLASLGFLFISGTATAANRFYKDDPHWKEPAPIPVSNVELQKIDNLIDFYKNTFHKKGERHQPGKVYPSQGINTLGEVPDNAWYTNRHREGRMGLQAMVTGPNLAGPPDESGKWTVTSAKVEGVTPGLTIKDSKGRRYLLKFDPKTNAELATGADAVGAKFFYAIGYNVPENYPIKFRREQLDVGEKVSFTDRFGRVRHLRPRDVDELLQSVASYSDGSVRALASLYISGKPVGPFKYYKRRADDPNELASHEHMRVLRGLYVFAAWLNHTDAKSLNSLDVIAEESGRTFVKHYLLDFGASLGSDSLYAKDPRLGHDYFLDPTAGVGQVASLGLYVPKYARVRYPELPAVGNFASQAFDADRWKSNYPNAAFENRLPGDEFWAAKQVMAFSDEEIRALVRTGNYSDERTPQVIADTLIRRRDLIGQTFFKKVLPFTDFAVESDQLKFKDLATVYKFRSEIPVEASWASFNNETQEKTPIDNSKGTELPASVRNGSTGSYWVATLRSAQQPGSVTVFLRKEDTGFAVVGLEREHENAWRAR
jgi:hypothetical protein